MDASGSILNNLGLELSSRTYRPTRPHLSGEVSTFLNLDHAGKLWEFDKKI